MKNNQKRAISRFRELKFWRVIWKNIVKIQKRKEGGKKIKGKAPKVG